MAVYQVREFESRETGAYSRSKEEQRKADTRALQAAIDACTRTGGSVVTEADRTYYIGTLYLKSDVTLVLSEGSVLEAAGTLEGYEETLDENGRRSQLETYAGRPVHAAIYARNADNIAIVGTGSIDGVSECFVTEKKRYHRTGAVYPRPAMIYMEGCRHLTFRSFAVKNAPFWTIHTAGCEQVRMENLCIRNRLDMANSDGIDIDHCKRVEIRGCHVSCADDALCLKNTEDNRRFGSCEEILIEKCMVQSTSAGIKIGTEGVDDFRNIQVRNCRIYGSNRGIAIQIRDEGNVSDVCFENIEIETRRFYDGWWGRAEPVSLTSLGRREGLCSGRIQNVRLKNIRCASENGICIYAEEEKIEDILLENVEVTMRLAHKWKAGFYDFRPCKGEGLVERENHALFVSGARRVTVKNCIFQMPEQKVDGFGALISDVQGAVRVESETDTCRDIAEDLRKLSSPVLFRGDDVTAYRDPAAVYWNGWFHLFFTLVETESDGSVFMYTAKSRSRDLRTWEKPVKLTVRDRSKNFSSPGNLVRFQGKWVLCLQSYCRENGEKYGNDHCRIYVCESEDLEHFSEPRLLFLKGKTKEADLGRMIDPYLLEDKDEAGKWWCFYKQNGVSMSWSRDLEHWQYEGHMPGGENVCVLQAEGRYQMFHSPENGIGRMVSEDGRNWKDTGEVMTLGQAEWDWARGRITAGTVIDVSKLSQETHFYLLFFHGSGPEDERTMFDCNASIGIAWSRDLREWDWPGKRRR